MKMIDKKRFNEIKEIAQKNSYLNCISWAIWNPHNISDTSMFTQDIEDIFPKLQPNKIVIGFAASSYVNQSNEFGAFHYKGKGHRDIWLYEATTDNGFEGAYLSDVYKVPIKVLESMKSDSIRIMNYYEKNFIEKEYQLRNLKLELDLLKEINSKLKIIALGDFAYGLIPDCYKKYTVKTSHYSRYGISKSQFLNEFKRAAELIKI